MMNVFFAVITPIIIGYLIGSFLPGYFLPKWKRNINILEVGDGNPGSINVQRNIGLSYGIITSIYDILKGILSMLIAQYLLHSSLLVINITGLFTILGHIFPFYLKFKGGRGIATAVGIFLLLMIKVSIKDFNVNEIITILLILLIYLFIIILVNRNFDLYAVTFIPFLILFILLKVKLFEDRALLIFCLFLIYKQAIHNFVTKKE